MEIIQINEENIADEHICCAISDKKCKEGYESKKHWLKSQFRFGYVFKKLNVRGKVFIEYVPAEYAWCPVTAPDYMLINCFWVSGQYKGKGNGKALLQECVNDSIQKNGLIVITSAKKQPFLSDKKFFQKQEFELADTAEPYFELWFKRFKPGTQDPKFKECAKKGECDIRDGLAVYYTDSCPFNEFYVNNELFRVAEKNGKKLKIIKLTSKEQAQNHFVPYTNYSVFYKGKFVTQHILNEKNFSKFISD